MDAAVATAEEAYKQQLRSIKAAPLASLAYLQLQQGRWHNALHYSQHLLKVSWKGAGFLVHPAVFFSSTACILVQTWALRVYALTLICVTYLYVMSLRPNRGVNRQH